ncbi:MucBP domain-containing protein [Secundilactobacillus hailunensis]|uniref:MucBP domain-containing protein n=1 Tax=Secundilactobacillus hailunensis TaxID=2559923 RepID=A0ABW1TAW8_9LACO|nr:MucBP domain-containing protein [Secundilactobacillus hailunensis]
MSFWDRLKKLMTKNRPRTPSRRIVSTLSDSSILKPKRDETQTITKQEPTSKTIKPSTATIDAPAKEQNGSAVMLVLYLDEQNQPLRKPQWLNGRLGEKVHFTPHHIEHYLLFHIIGFATHFASPYRIMTLQFTKEMGHPVILYSVDYDTREMLAAPVIQTGAVNQPFAFSKTELDSFHLIKANRPLTGHFTEASQTIVVMLRRNNWTAVQRISIFVRLKGSTQILDQPDGQPYRYEFPKNSVWRAFIRVNTQTGETWFNLGGPQWINGKNVTQTNRPENKQLGKREPVVFRPINRSAIIDFVAGRSLHVYAEPNGRAIKLIADGTKIQITGEYNDSNHLKWYRLADDSIIRAQYVKFK